MSHAIHTDTCFVSGCKPSKLHCELCLTNQSELSCYQQIKSCILTF